ncbi:glycoside hydrolase family 51 protein [Polychaeton citri CBS 116435]|uniref:non-reducing end alpha-L-arabinofuranosidase n=1 Tax=Polychaeton citri CBS 116435 TaxID=1314669 RepID=A0A9P4Q3B7_9PEZI|nr:glycoside hydrolase family 51 protein [Polychaeton citri CBS 116435]
MFEDINNSGDGGVYAELVRNRAFQGDGPFPKNLDYWSALGGAGLSLQNLSNPLSSALTASIQVEASNATNTVGFSNAGFWGFPVQAAWEYTGSFWVNGDFDGNITASLKSTDKQILASANVEVTATGGQWTQFNYTFQPSSDAPNSNNTLDFEWDASEQSGALNFNLISLFPPTYNDRPNGLRIDLMEAMQGLKPKLFRLPGGNNLEGSGAPYFWNWTETIGPLEQRPGFPGTWNYENTNGLGLIEYMLWAEDLGAEVLLAVWAGLWLDGTIVPEDQLQPYVQLALDELEFLTGDTSTSWGSLRAQLGHPEPFSVNFVEVGNEDSLNGGKDSYDAYRFQAFYDAISQAYPEIVIIASYYDVGGPTPPGEAGGDFHQYSPPVQMSSQFGYFDNYTSEHPVLIGEYAVVQFDVAGEDVVNWNSGPRAGAPFWQGTVAEAIFLLSAERNSDKILSAMYAPSFQNQNQWEWLPDLISYDANPDHLVLSTSYHMIQLFSNNLITETLPTVITNGDYNPAYWVAGRNADTGSHILKAAVYNATENVPFNLTIEGVQRGAKATLTFLTAPSVNSTNEIGSTAVQNHTSGLIAARGGVFSFELPAYSIAVLEVSGQAAGYGRQESRSGWKGFKKWHHNGY